MTLRTRANVQKPENVFISYQKLLVLLTSTNSFQEHLSSTSRDQK